MKSTYRSLGLWFLSILMGFYATTGLADSQKVPILYSQTALSATVSPTSQTGWYRLTLKQLHKKTTWFTDRPVRQSGLISHTKFLKIWSENTDNSFAKDNPEANLVAFLDSKDHESQESVVLRLSHPVYDKESNTLQYDVQLISKNGQRLLESSTVYDVALFIDGFDLSVRSMQ